MVHTSLPGGGASPRQPLVAEELCLLAQVAHQARHRHCCSSNWNHHALIPAASRALSLMKAPAQESITGAGSVATSQPPLLFQALPAGTVPREEPLLGSCCYIKNEEGLELLRHAGGDVSTSRFPRAPWDFGCKNRLQIASQESRFIFTFLDFAMEAGSRRSSPRSGLI